MSAGVGERTLLVPACHQVLGRRLVEGRCEPKRAFGHRDLNLRLAIPSNISETLGANEFCYQLRHALTGPIVNVVLLYNLSRQTLKDVSGSPVSV